MSKDTSLSQNIENRDNQNRNAQLAEQVSERPTIAPAVDVYENKDEYLLIADVPGADKDGLEINLEDGRLTLTARRQDRRASATSKVREYWTHDFRRVFVLPEDVDVEKTAARLDGGTLTINVPKVAAAKPRRIPVHSA